MSNSPLVDYVRISPNQTRKRTHKIDTITVHCVVGQLSVETVGNIFANPSRQASSNYCVGFDGRIGMYVEEKSRSWCSSNAANDHRAVTIEVACDVSHPYAVTPAAMQSLIELIADICKRNGIPKLLWKNDKKLIGNVKEQNMTLHRWFAATACPGEYLYSKHEYLCTEVNKKLEGGNKNMVDGQLYRVQVGAYAVKSNADKMLKKLKSEGYDAIIVGNAPFVAATSLKVGDTVKLKQGSLTYNGKALAPFVYDREHKISELKGDRAVISFNGVVVASVNKNDLVRY